ncbi:MAG TPA: hypothetical protein VGY77_04265 [Gemmataceae bacterium]|jgi:hypothetical protein|nr:hypothetical protein [Gemmataceae bacterium]
MSSFLTRRKFVVRSVQAGALANLGNFAFLRQLPLISGAEVKVTPEMVQFHPDIEPLVRLVEDTDRGKLLEVIADKIRQGTSYSQVLAAILLAGVRNIQPRPVGFEFHAVLVVNSAHMAALAAPDTDRWMPLFWALDNFKSSQATKIDKGGWKMPALEDGKLPPTAHAKKRFIEAMDDWNEDGADRAIAALVRDAGAADVIELFWRYGARDFRDIGHKAIYAANAWRTLQTIGWRHAEPVMRSLAFALLEHKENGNPAKLDAAPDRPWRENLQRVRKIRADWFQGEIQPQATTDLLATLRTANPPEACEKIVDQLNNKVSPASLWDALFLHAGELLMRQPGIVGIHCVTSTNALHYGFQTSGNDETRRLLLLQTGAFLCLFRQAMAGRGKLREDLKIDTLESGVSNAKGMAAIEEIFTDLGKDRLLAARKTLALLDSKALDPEQMMTHARRLLFSKGRDSHDYKFSSAALEDFFHTTSTWRNRFLATSMFNLRGSTEPDNGLVNRTKAALRA